MAFLFILHWNYTIHFLSRLFVIDKKLNNQFSHFEITIFILEACTKWWFIKFLDKSNYKIYETNFDWVCTRWLCTALFHFREK